MRPFAAFGRMIRSVYGKGSVYFDILIRILFSAGTFLWIRHEIGYSKVLSGLFVIAVLSLLSGLLTVRVVPVFAAIMICGNAFAVSPDIGAAVTAVFLVMIWLFLRFVPDDAPAAVLTAAAASFGLVPLIPICCGLRRSPASAAACCAGLAAGAMTAALKADHAALAAMETSDYAGRLSLFLKDVFTDSLAVSMIAVTAVVILVYAVRTLGFPFCFELSIILGAMIYVLFMILAGHIIGTDLSAGEAVRSALISAGAAFLLLAFLLPLKYRRTERLRFEDDHYYYFVKAVPKALSGAPYRDEHEPSGDQDRAPQEEMRPAGADLKNYDFESKLEDSLKDL